MAFVLVVAHSLRHSGGGVLPPLSLLTIDVVRHQLLFQRTIPGFEPSVASVALALEFYEIGRALMMAAGVRDQGDVDVFTALVAGLSHQASLREFIRQVRTGRPVVPRSAPKTGGTA